MKEPKFGEWSSTASNPPLEGQECGEVEVIGAADGCKFVYVYQCRKWDGDRQWYDSGGHNTMPPRYWMPLPPHPAEPVAEASPTKPPAAPSRLVRLGDRYVDPAAVQSVTGFKVSGHRESAVVVGGEKFYVRLPDHEVVKILETALAARRSSA